MKKGFLRKSTKNFIINIIVVLILMIIMCSIIQFTNHKEAEKQVDLIELGMKASDLKWLARAGEISEEELTEFQKSASNLSVEEANQLLDELLEGKEEEYLEKQEVLLSKIQSALNN